MGVGLVLIGEAAGGFDHIFNPQFTPGDISRFAVIEYLDMSAVHFYAAVIRRNRLAVNAHYRIVLKQMGQRVIISQVINADNFQIGKCFILTLGAEDRSADPTKTVDANFNSHCVTSSGVFYMLMRIFFLENSIFQLTISIALT